jgi:hypothetical protein
LVPALGASPDQPRNLIGELDPPTVLLRQHSEPRQAVNVRLLG